jgi:hypothetical protein
MDRCSAETPAGELRHLAIAACALMLCCALSLSQRQHRRSEQLALLKKERVEVTARRRVARTGIGLIVLATFHHEVPSEATLIVQSALNRRSASRF